MTMKMKMKMASATDIDEESRGAWLSQHGIAGLTTDLGGIVRGWNSAAAKLYGRDAGAMIGTPIGAIGLSQQDDAIAASIVAELLAAGHWRGELEVRDAAGVSLRLDVRATVRMEGARPVGFEAVVFDVSQRVQAERLATESEWRLGVAQRIAGLASWEWHLGEDQFITSEQYRSLAGLEGGTKWTVADPLGAMPNEDRRRVRSAIDEMRLSGANSLSLQYRMHSADGEWHWLEAHCWAVRASDGGLAGVRGTTQDITERVHAQKRLREAGEFWQATLDSLSAHVAVLDEDGNVVAVNSAWRRYSESEGGASDYVGSNYLAVCARSDDPTGADVARGLEGVLAGRDELFELEYSCHSPTTRRWFVLRITRYAGSGPLRAVVAHADVTERREAREQAFLQAALLDQIDVSVIVTDLNMRIVSWSAGAQRLYGWAPEEAIGRGPAELFAPRDIGSRDGVIAALQRTGVWEGEFLASRKDGSTFAAYVRMRMIADQQGRGAAFVGVSMDVSEQKESELALLSARNHLRAVTDSMGEGLYTLDSAGRLTYMNQVAQDLLGWTAEELNGRLLQPFAHHRRAHGLPPAIEDCPITRAGRDGKVVRVDDDIFIRPDGSELPVAYTAAPFATGDGAEGCVVVFEDITQRKAAAELVERDLKKVTWARRIEEALREDRFVLHAQPIVDLRTLQVVQCELLIRMRPSQDPDDERVIPPGAFLAVAEEYGLIADIDRWVIDRSMEFAVARGQPVELNVSARSVSDPSLVDHIKNALQRTEADPATIVFEITETTLVSDEKAGRRFVESLHGLGCKVALDDFGTGYGGFTYLKHLPIDLLKIDIEFIRDLTTNAASRNVVRGIVNLAHGFGLKTIGEGVEDRRTLAMLPELGVDYAQGFHIGRPGPLRALTTHPKVQEVNTERRHTNNTRTQRQAN